MNIWLVSTTVLKAKRETPRDLLDSRIIVNTTTSLILKSSEYGENRGTHLLIQGDRR